MLNNVFKTAGIDGQQPWKQYYKGIKPKNPLGGDFVHRMGNKVKPVLSTSMNKQMQFSFMKPIASFSADPNYVPPYIPKYPQNPYNTTSDINSAGIPIPPSMNQPPQPAYYGNAQPYTPGLDPIMDKKLRVAAERSAREQRREDRQEVSNTRANYRTFLDSAREARGWTNTLGLV